MGVKIAAYPKCFEYEIGLHRTMSVFDWISLAQAELDVEGLEMYDRFFTSLDRDYLFRVIEAVTDAGFVIPMFICSPDFTHPDPDERKRAIEYQAKMTEVTALLGGEGAVCRVLSGQCHPGVSREQGVEWVIEAIQQVIPVARENGVILGMENHYKDSQWRYPEFALKMEVFLEIIEAIDERQHFGVQYDPSNAIVAGDDPIALLEAIKDRVVSMHASDRYFKDGVTMGQIQQADGTMGYAPYLCHGVIGKGLNDYDRIFSILSEAGYDGWVSIEDGVNGVDDMRESVEFLQQMREKYFAD
jgi:sugar phosphate isomerase/epimerase